MPHKYLLGNGSRLSCLLRYGLEDDQSDTDRRGIYLPPAELNWSLYGVPEQLENEETQEAYWELQKFIVLALKANPNVLECLYSPIVEFERAYKQTSLPDRPDYERVNTTNLF